MRWIETFLRTIMNDLNDYDGSLMTPSTPTPSECVHARTTTHGSNDGKRITKCKDCGLILQEEKLTPSEKMKTTSPKECPHEDRDERRTTGRTWKWRCKTCGHTASGDKYLGESARPATARSEGSASPVPTTPMRTPQVTPSPTMATDQEDYEVDRIVDLVRHVVDVQREVGQTISLNQRDKIYDRCRSADDKPLNL